MSQQELFVWDLRSSPVVFCYGWTVQYGSFRHSHGWQFVDAGCLLVSSLRLSTSACMGPLHLAWDSHSMLAGFWEWVFPERIPRSIGRSCKASYDPALEVPESHIQLVKQVTKASPDSRGGEKKTPPLNKGRNWWWPFWRHATTYRPSGPNTFLPHANYTHPLLRPSKVSSHYGISLMSRISVSNSGPGVIEASQMQFLRHSYWSLVPFDLNKETNYLLPHTQHTNVQ